MHPWALHTCNSTTFYNMGIFSQALKYTWAAFFVYPLPSSISPILPEFKTWTVVNKSAATSPPVTINTPVASCTNITPSPSHAQSAVSPPSRTPFANSLRSRSVVGCGSTTPLPPFATAPRKAPTPPCSKLTLSQLEVSFHFVCGGSGVRVGLRHPQRSSSSRQTHLPRPPFRHAGTGGTPTAAFMSLDVSLTERNPDDMHDMPE